MEQKPDLDHVVVAWYDPQTNEPPMSPGYKV